MEYKRRYALYTELDNNVNTLYFDAYSFKDALDSFDEYIRNYDLYKHIEVILYRDLDGSRTMIKKVKIDFEESEDNE